MYQLLFVFVLINLFMCQCRAQLITLFDREEIFPELHYYVKTIHGIMEFLSVAIRHKQEISNAGR